MDKKVDSKLTKLLDRFEYIKDELADATAEIEQLVLNAYDDGNEFGYREGCEETEKKLAE